MNTKKILIVEDNIALAEAIHSAIKSEKAYHLFLADDLNSAQKMLNQQDIDLIILDRMLGNEDSLSLLPWIKEHHPKTRIIFLSVKGSPRDKVEGLKLGGDDYLAKPFDIEELLVRIEKLLENATPIKNTLFSFGDNQVDFQMSHAKNYRNETLVLSEKERELLQYFVSHANSLMSRDELFRELWDTAYNKKSRVIDNHILRFRKFFEPSPEEPKYFLSKRGGGYIFSTH